MANRTRNFVLRVPVTPEERALIQQKMAQLHTKNFSAYARKMLIDGYIVHMDTSDIRAQTAELQKIGVNGRRGTLTAGWTTISSFTMRRSSIPSWDRRAFTAIIPPSGPWT